MIQSPPTPLLIIVTGLPCTGKTTLARKLATDLGLPLVAKDEIKERLFDSLGWSDREWSKKLSRATFDLMFYFIELELRAGHSLIAEAPFTPFSAVVLSQIQHRQTFRMLVIECVTPGEILLQRFVQRGETGKRHPGHADRAIYAEAKGILLGEKPAPLDLGGRRIELDTSDFARLDLDQLVSTIRLELLQG